MNTQPENGSIKPRDWLNALGGDDRDLPRGRENATHVASGRQPTWLDGLPDDELQQSASRSVEATTATDDDGNCIARSEEVHGDQPGGRPSSGSDWLAAVGGTVEVSFAEPKRGQSQTSAAVADSVLSPTAATARSNRRPVLVILLGGLLFLETLGLGVYFHLATGPARAPLGIASAPEANITPAQQEPKGDSGAELVVRPDGQSRFTTLTEALKEAPPGSRIAVHPGRYHERLVLEKPVEIVGVGRRQEVVFEAGAGSTVVLKTSRATIRGVTIEQSGEAGEVEASAIDVADGQLVLDDCAIRSQGKDCVRAQGDTASLIIRHCAVRDGASSGIRFGGRRTRSRGGLRIRGRRGGGDRDQPERHSPVSAVPHQRQEQEVRVARGRPGATSCSRIASSPVAPK